MCTYTYVYETVTKCLKRLYRYELLRFQYDSNNTSVLLNNFEIRSLILILNYDAKEMAIMPVLWNFIYVYSLDFLLLIVKLWVIIKNRGKKL